MVSSSSGKPATRRTLLSRRDAMTAEARAQASSVIAAKAIAELDLAVGSVVALYAEKASEVETGEIDRAARDRGLVVVYPRVPASGRVLTFAAAERGALVAGPVGLREPAAGAPAIALEEIAVCFVPGVAFDREGHRLGWGRGYYDATLAAAPGARRIALAFECQLVERVPHDSHDVRMQMIITEVATHVA